MSLSWSMARRMHGGGAGGPAVAVATWGVALGLAVMLVSVCVVSGFKAAVRDRVAGIGSHMQVLSAESFRYAEGAPIQVTDQLLDELRAVPGVSWAQRYCLKTGMLKTDDAFQGVAFRGVDGGYNLDFLRSCVVAGQMPDTIAEGQLLVSRQIANTLRLTPGSKVYAYFFDGKLRARRFTVEAVYESGVTEMDRTLALCHIGATRQLLGYAPDQATGAEVLVQSFDSLAAVCPRVRELMAHRQDDYGQYYTCPAVTDLFPNIFSWLDLLDVNVAVILILMMCVAGFTTISGLLILVLERTQFIGVMKAMGAGNALLRRIFVNYAMLIVLRGALLGDAIGLGLCLAQRWLGIVTLDPATYYVDAVPVLFPWPALLAVNAAALLLSLLALLLPSLAVASVRPAKAIRFQ